VTVREPRVAIDGPAGAGKSTVSKSVAEKLGYLLLDTGALYRCVALAAKGAGASWKDDTAASRVAQALADREAIRFEPGPSGQNRILLDERDVTTAIRTQEIAEGASQVSALPGVRAALLDMQRKAARAGGVVLEGRDIGTVVLPDAEAKFFLTALADERAERRHRELMARGQASDLEVVRREIEERDRRDSGRAIAPLKRADDAILVDSTSMTIDEVVDTIVRAVVVVRERLRAADSAR
jgi:cytidylate kinase